MSKSKPRKTLTSATWAVCLSLLLIGGCAAQAVAAPTPDKILCRPELAASRRQELAERLREITGWRNLHFSEDGILRFGASQAEGGSQTARELLQKAARGSRLLVFEDASRRADVVFSRVVEGRWKKDAGTKPSVYLVQVDFKDFSHVMGDRDALAAFNVGWGVLHEISHAVNDSPDTERAGEVGECEALVNRMRRECGLAERAEYHFHLYPGQEQSQFKTKLVRLAFEHQEPETNKKRRLWLMWNAELVGGLK
ncbi:MAG: hypothetical protein H0T60_12385 [Acidobacteria bacterium]|nr:hypothetical protein [Acidobacteriota bacterium]